MHLRPREWTMTGIESYSDSSSSSIIIELEVTRETGEHKSDGG